MGGEAELEGEIRFFQSCIPSLPPGDYSVKVDQTLRMGEEAKYDEELKFTIAGPRFSLAPSDIYSVFPPRGETGAYDNALPHIVFTRKTIPWERTIHDKPQDPKAPCPFAALLVVSDKDDIRTESQREEDKKANKPPFGAVRSAKVSELLDPGSEVRGPKGVKINDKYESPDDLCNVVDLPSNLFQSIVPAKDDLPYLAHVRKVDSENKETLSRLGDGCYSVIVANRFPETTVKTPVTKVENGKVVPVTEVLYDGREAPVFEEKEGQKNTAYLVSLEGFDGYLHGGKTISEKTVRLAVLASWSFTCRGRNDFKVLMYNLDPLKGNHDGSDGRLCIPPPEPAAKDNASKTVADAFEHGYVGLNHTVRIGEKTVSWYRGPLVPLNIEKHEDYPFYPCADAALGYDYKSGLFETTYAAAWQLGRLLALQDRLFTKEVYLYRREVTQVIAEEIRTEATRHKFKITDGKTDALMLERHALRQLMSAEGQRAVRSLSGKGSNS
ncbi:hypothetical protein PJI16_16165 [Nitrospira sp. MA-1]|nr:hypothetical protein [Nitrospira sp. MA-1]